MNATYCVIAISFGQSTEYWNSSLVNDECTTKNAESAECFTSLELAAESLCHFAIPYATVMEWDVEFSIEKIN